MLKEPTLQQTINYLIEKAKMLSFSYEKQCENIQDFARWNLASDMANDWFDSEVKLLKELVAKKQIGENAAVLYEKINNNFADVSCGGSHFEEVVWEHEGLKNHPFWEKQRELARKLLTELNKNKN